MNIMAEEIAMAEVMKLLESEPTPAALPAALPAVTFLSFASSLRFWFLPANAKKQSA